MILKISMLAIDSSNIDSMKFNYAGGTSDLTLSTRGNLDVLFSSGSMYRYLQVPLGAFLDVAIAESKGKAFNDKIKNTYSYEKLWT